MRYNAIMQLLIFASLAFGQLFAATFTVTKTTDTLPSGVSGELRWAITQSNLTKTGTNLINFSIPGTAPFIITPKADLPAITKPVTINGYSQSGATANTATLGSNAVLKIVLDGTVASASANGIKINGSNGKPGTGNGLYFAPGSSGSTVQGLVVSNWLNNGILIYPTLNINTGTISSPVNNIKITGNFIGTNAAGTAVAPNQSGIWALGCSGLVIGTQARADRNIIAGSYFFFNQSACVEVIACSRPSIQNNYIGLNSAGNAVLGASLAGIDCSGCAAPLIGGAGTPGSGATAQGNVIAGHSITGVSLNGTSNGLIQNNFIGLNNAGIAALANGNMGIALTGYGSAYSTTKNLITGNVIGGWNIGIKVGFAESPGVNGNTVQGNIIGLDAAGSAALPNDYGIVVNNGNNMIGGFATQHTNVISGNTVGGVWLFGADAPSNLVQGNNIGYNLAKNSAIPNGFGVLYGPRPLAIAGSNNTFGGGDTASLIPLT